jgi:hypothetical protein
MTQALYAHTNNKKIKINFKKSSRSLKTKSKVPDNIVLDESSPSGLQMTTILSHGLTWPFLCDQVLFVCPN